MLNNLGDGFAEVSASHLNMELEHALFTADLLEFIEVNFSYLLNVNRPALQRKETGPINQHVKT